MGVTPLGKEVRFLVPMLRNGDCEPHDIAQWEWIEDEMHVRYPNGWQMRQVERTETTVTGKVRGHWFDKKKQERVPDDSVEFVVAVRPEQMSELETFFGAICARFDQKCLYFTRDGEALLYEPDEGAQP
jgi:hypothetical protein